MAAQEIITFDDLMALLERRPDYLARLRQIVLDEEFRQLPAQVRSLIQTVESHTALLQSLAASMEAQARILEEHSAALKAQGRTLEEQGAALKAQGRTLEEQGAALKTQGQMLETHNRQLARHERQLSRLIGDEAERRFRQNAAAYFSDILRRIRVTDKTVLADRIDDAIDASQLAAGDRRSLLALDLAVEGLDRETRQPTRLAVEVSAGIGEGDILRAKDRAGLLEKLTGEPTLPVVAGYSIAPVYRQLAEDKGVAVTIVAPPDAGEPEELEEPVPVNDDA